MTYQRTPIRFGVGVGGLGAFAYGLTVFLLFTLPRRVLGERAGSAFLENWFYPIATASDVLTLYATPVLAGVCGLYLTYAEAATVRNVFLGFVVGGVAFGATVTLLDWAVTGPLYRQPTLEYVAQFARLSGRIVAPAVAGAFAGSVVGNRR